MPRPSAAGSNHAPSVWKSLIRGVVRLAVGMVALALLMVALLMGLVLALGLVAWALLRGRRPARGVFTAAFRRARPRCTRAEGPVIDIESREVPEPRAANARASDDRR